jgi:AAA+ superfamily predicted ATPase
MERNSDIEKIEEVLDVAKKTQWGCVGNIYFDAIPTVSRLPPGYYVINNVYGEIRFLKQKFSIDGIVVTGSPNTKIIVDDFEKFWTMEEKFRQYNIAYKRGFFLSGPPGSGKTCVLKILSHSVIKKGGVVIDMRESPGSLGRAIGSVRDIHDNMPILVAFEDLDKYYEDIHENLLNIMDGMVKINNIVFVATTNYPEAFDESIINRPGRFDGHYKMSPPGSKVREDFINTFLTPDDRSKYPINKWVIDTKGLPFGHIKELIISVAVLGNDYSGTLERIKNMSNGIEESYDEE